MSAKQFKLSSETVLQYQIMDNDTDLNENEVVDLLNKLYEENKQMKGEIIKLGVKWRVLSQKNDSLRYENEQLKERVMVLEKLISDVETSEGMSIDNLIDTEMIGDE